MGGVDGNGVVWMWKGENSGWDDVIVIDGCGYVGEGIGLIVVELEVRKKLNYCGGVFVVVKWVFGELEGVVR